jgi:hypothetical protein
MSSPSRHWRLWIHTDKRRFANVVADRINFWMGQDAPILIEDHPMELDLTVLPFLSNGQKTQRHRQIGTFPLQKLLYNGQVKLRS